MQIPIKRAIERVPGGMMVVPLLIGALMATFIPGTPHFFGSFTGALGHPDFDASRRSDRRASRHRQPFNWRDGD